VGDEPGPCDWAPCFGHRFEGQPARPFLFSIQREFIAKFRAGTKRFELRTRRPNVRPNEVHLVYESRGSGLVVAEMKIGWVDSGPPRMLWEEHCDALGVGWDFFDEYFTATDGLPREVGYAVEMVPHWLPAKRELDLPMDMVPPQSWARWTGEPVSASVGDIYVDRVRRIAVIAGRERKVSRIDAGVLAYLVRRPGVVVSRFALLREVWGDTDPNAETRTVDVRMARIRGLFPELEIQTVYRNGYRLKAGGR
jgi:predicted transcriptional regulator